jgi:hypothetical protein
MLQKVINVIYQDTLEFQEFREKGDATSSVIHVHLPGVPALNAMQTLYQQGILKYESYRHYISQFFTVPLSDLYAKPKLSLLEVNGLNAADIEVTDSIEPPSKKPKSK